jgi:hypothetical protein
VIVSVFPLAPWLPPSGVLQHALEVVTWIVLDPVVLEACSRTGTRDGQGLTLIVPFAPPLQPSPQWRSPGLLAAILEVESWIVSVISPVMLESS